MSAPVLERHREAALAWLLHEWPCDRDDTADFARHVTNLAQLLADAEARVWERAEEVCEAIALEYRNQHDPGSESIADECADALRAAAKEGT